MTRATWRWPGSRLGAFDSCTAWWTSWRVLGRWVGRWCVCDVVVVVRAGDGGLADPPAGRPPLSLPSSPEISSTPAAVARAATSKNGTVRANLLTEPL